MVLVTDADNTLWDTNAMYADAQISLYKRISQKLKLSTSKESLSFVREIDQAIAQKHPEASDGNPGNRTKPLKTISAAAEILGLDRYCQCGH